MNVEPILIGLLLIGYVAAAWWLFDTLGTWHRQSRAVTNTNSDSITFTRADAGPDSDSDSNRNSPTLGTYRRDFGRRTIHGDHYGFGPAPRPRGRHSYIPDA